MIPQQLWQHSGHLGKMKGPAQLLSLGLAISGSWESQCTWRFLADGLIFWIVTSDVSALTLQPTEMGSLPLKQVLYPNKVDVLHIPTHTFVSFPPWKVPVAVGQLCFLSRQRKDQEHNTSSQDKTQTIAFQHCRVITAKALHSLLRWHQTATAERSFQKIKNATITRNLKTN